MLSFSRVRHEDADLSRRDVQLSDCENSGKALAGRLPVEMQE
jgi:hypothetical protein